MEDIAWNVVGRRQPRTESDLYRDRADRPNVEISNGRLVRYNGRYSVLGAITNTDSDPAHVTVQSDLLGNDSSLARQNAGRVFGQRLLPAETSGFRVDFEGILPLSDDQALGDFDPTIFIPPRLSEPPKYASLNVTAMMTDTGLYRSVGLNNIRIYEEDGAPVIRALAVNTGTLESSITRVIALAFDTQGQAIWTETGFVESNIYPGQSAPVVIKFPKASEIEVIADINAPQIQVNGRMMQQSLGPTSILANTIPLDIPGYSALRLYVSSFVNDPSF
jgi:hypothetical protein